MIDAVIARLKARTTLRSVEGAASLQRLMANKVVPAGTHAAYVVPLGLQGGTEESITGLFRQTLTEAVGVILIRNAWGSARGGNVQDELSADIQMVIAALAGWAPQSGPGVFRVVRGQLVGSENSAVVYQLDFAIPTQMRITP